MSIASILWKLGQSRLTVVEKTVTATLTADEMKAGAIKASHATVAIALTLPAAGTCAGYAQVIYDGNAAALTVIAPNAFGGATNDTLTLARGEFAIVWSDGSEWYEVHNEPAAT